MRVAACQLPDVRGDISYASELIRDYAARAEEMGAALVCFPECFLQGYCTDIESVTRLAIDIESSGFDAWLATVRALQPTLVVGLIERRGNDFFNTAVVVRNGRLLCRYRKVHLLDAERDAFLAGTEPGVFEIDGVNVGLSICFDLNFATVFDASVAAGARIIVAPCNNMMKQEAAEKWRDEHNVVRCERARESRVWLLTSDITGRRDGRVSYGPTALIRPDGVVVGQVPLMTSGMLVLDAEVSVSPAKKHAAVAPESSAETACNRLK